MNRLILDIPLQDQCEEVQVLAMRYCQELKRELLIYKQNPINDIPETGTIWTELYGCDLARIIKRECIP